MHKFTSKLATALLLSVLIGFPSPVRAGASFQQAIAHYNAGKYSQALGEFKQFAAAYPTNAQSHYYMAMCYQSLGNIAGAKQEYALTTQYGDASLNAYAQKALRSLGGTPGNGGSVSAAAVPAAVRVTASAPSAAPSSTVTQVLEFYTDWCHVCKEFEPVWSATQGRVSGVQFHRYNAEDSNNASLVQTYHVKAYPTLVYLDNSGKVLRNSAGCPASTEDFVRSIQFEH